MILYFFKIPKIRLRLCPGLKYRNISMWLIPRDALNMRKSGAYKTTKNLTGSFQPYVSTLESARFLSI